MVGLDVFRAAQIQPALLAQAEDFADTLRAETVFLSPAARDWLGLEIGAMLPVQVGLREGLRVAGWLLAEARARVAVMDIAGAQRLLERPVCSRAWTSSCVRAPRGRATSDRRAAAARGAGGPPDSAIEATGRMTRLSHQPQCWRWWRCSPAACWCSPPGAVLSAGAHNSRCCVCWVTRDVDWSPCCRWKDDTGRPGAAAGLLFRLRWPPSAALHRRRSGRRPLRGRRGTRFEPLACELFALRGCRAVGPLLALKGVMVRSQLKVGD